jgi:hypothetical protein
MAVLTQSAVRSDGTTFNSVVKFENSGGTQNGTLCRAWVNFKGTDTVTINANFNVNSISDNGTGAYGVTFTNAMPDAKYSALALASPFGVENESFLSILGFSNATASNLSLISKADAGPDGINDKSTVNVAIFR